MCYVCSDIHGATAFMAQSGLQKIRTHSQIVFMNFKLPSTSHMTHYLFQKVLTGEMSELVDRMLT